MQRTQAWHPIARVVLLVLATALGGCASAPPAGPAAQAVPEAFREGSPASGAALPAGGWWRVFADPGLDALVERAARDNPGLKQLEARSAQARAALQAVAAEGLPQVGLGTGAARRTGALVNAAGERGNLFTAELTLQHDLDLAARRSRAGQAAGQDLAAQQAMERDAALELQARLAQAWLQWRTARAELQLLQRLVDIDRELTLQLERRVRAGLATQADLGPARERQRDDEAAVQRALRRQALAKHALAAAVADPLLQLPPSTDTAADLPPLPSVPAGLPASVLQRRPDVAAAEARLQAARWRLGLARDAWFPQLTLTGNAGLASADLGHWLKAAARSTGIGLLLSLPVFDGGRADAARAAAEAELQRTAAEHRERVLEALREVDDGLATLRTLAAEAELRLAAVADAERDAAHAASRRAHGLVPSTEPLLAQRLALRERHALLQVQLAQREATVTLVRALGGGWGEAPARVAALQP